MIEENIWQLILGVTVMRKSASPAVKEEHIYSAKQAGSHLLFDTFLPLLHCFHYFFSTSVTDIIALEINF